MKELEAPCKTCVHKTVCTYLAQTTRLIVNMNTDINSGNYPGNIVLHISCTDYTLCANLLSGSTAFLAKELIVIPVTAEVHIL